MKCELCGEVSQGRRVRVDGLLLCVRCQAGARAAADRVRDIMGEIDSLPIPYDDLTPDEINVFRACQDRAAFAVALLVDLLDGRFVARQAWQDFETYSTDGLADLLRSMAE